MVCDASTCEQNCSEGAKCTIVRKGEHIPFTPVIQVEHKTPTTEFEVIYDFKATDPAPSNIGPMFSASRIFMLNFMLLKLVF